MGDYRLSTPAFVAATFDQNDEDVLLYIKENPGCNRTDIRNDLGLNKAVVAMMVSILERDHYIQKHHDINGLETLWEAADFIRDMQQETQNARDWLLQEESGLVSEMATALQIPFEQAVALSNVLRHEGSAMVTGLE